ncbi:MAG: NADH-quinone oxidoreductase subunit NuoI [Desulfovibrio sp.]|jgi:NADH-quinone oxidoreductase subunit I|nr:NADH-quinone oxidoreductase subunit NuoI [Desulfovibrio sp.]MBI4958651.1 NADH-quinone oxidoreductase subunit NuoI [Desulfovibrio sp.]
MDERNGFLKNMVQGTTGLMEPFWVTLKHLFRKPITEQYPEYKRELPPRARGRIVLTRSPDKEERCVACQLCSAACPVSCISMQSAVRQDGRRYAEWFRINFGRCIFCGLCEEACPTLAIQLTPDFEMSEDDPLKLIYEKHQLLVDHGGKDPDYDFYKHAGVAVGREPGTHDNEHPAANPKTNFP